MRVVVNLSIFGMAGAASMLLGQVTSDIAPKLNSSNWIERSGAYRRIATKENRTSGETTALVSLLSSEAALLRQSIETGGDDKGEGYGEYLGQLTDTVVAIAEKEPERADVWPALATCDHDGDSAFGSWLAAHADKTAQFAMACAKETNQVFRGQALALLAQIVVYERAATTSHHLRSSEVDGYEVTVRTALGDSNTYVRMSAVMALAIMGKQSDLAILESIAATDPAFDAQIAAEGPQYNPYPVRYEAGLAIKRLEARLKAQQ